MTQNMNGKGMIQNWDGKNVDKKVTQYWDRNDKPRMVEA